ATKFRQGLPAERSASPGLHSGQRQAQPGCAAGFLLAVLQGQAATVGFGDLAAQGQSIPDPPGLVVKKGTNRLAVLESPGPSSSTRTSNSAPVFAQPIVTPPLVSRAASAALRNRLMSNCSN